MTLPPDAYQRVRLALLLTFTASSDERVHRGTNAVLTALTIPGFAERDFDDLIRHITAPEPTPHD